jgi:phytoene synthase
MRREQTQPPTPPEPATAAPRSAAPVTAVPPPAAAALTPDEIARRSKSNFLASFVLLPRDRRRGLAAIYAFCRAVDDAADEPRDPAEARAQLAFWRAELEAVTAGQPRTRTGKALQDTVRRFGTDPAHLAEVLDGVAMDVEPQPFADLPALDLYCHRVASAVGLACLPVFGAAGPGATAYALELGLALQLTNILRDLAPDAREGRVYLPQDALARHGVDPAWLAGQGPAAAYADGGPVDRLIAEFAALARRRFARTLELRPDDQRRALRPAEAMAVVYEELLDQVEARRGRLDRPGRLRVTRRRKVWLLLRTWLRGGRR